MRSLEVVNQLAITSDVFSFDEFAAAHGGSASAASNAVRRLTEMGLVDRVSRGAYVVRPIGRMGTRAAAEDITLAVQARFGGELHRIAYRSALDHHGLLTRSSVVVQVVTERQLSITELGGRPFRSIIESPTTISIGKTPAGHGAFVSDVERSLLDAARRPDLVGGVSTIADSLSRLERSDYDPDRIVHYASVLDLAGPLRRLGSIAKLADHRDILDAIVRIRRHRHLVPANPRSDSETRWVDPDLKVAWTQADLDELGVDPAEA